MPKRVVHLRGSNAMLGAERVILELSRRTGEFGYESVIVALQAPSAAEPELLRQARATGIRTEVLTCHGRFDPAVFARLRKLLRRLQADLLHCHGYKENFYGLLGRGGLPCVATNHLWKRTTPALRFYCWLDGRVSRHFDHVVAVSEPIRQELLAAGVPADRISRIANGLDVIPFQQPLLPTERAAVRAGLGVGPGRLAVGMVGRLGSEKGHNLALQAVAALRARFPQLVLVIVGDGPLLADLQEVVLRLDLGQHVVFCGQRQDIPDILRALDAFILPSLTEGLPMALLEAMAAGLPAVASQVGDVPAVIEDGVSGILVPPGRLDALVKGLALLCSSPELRQELGKAAAVRIANRFSAREMARQYCQLYERLQHAAQPLAARG